MPRRQLMAICALLLALIAAPARADQAATLLQGLAVESFAAKSKAVERLAETGDARIVAPLQALLNGDLHRRKSDGKIVIVATRQGAIFHIEALSGRDLGKAGRRDARKITVNNRLRRVIRTALGRLTLFSPDPARRLAAARAMFKRGDASALPEIEAALESERAGDVRRALRQALAAVRLRHAPEPAVRIAAARRLAAQPDRDVRDLLATVARTEGLDAGLAAAIAAASAAVDRHLFWFDVLQNLFQGLSLASVLLLAAIGLAITFGVMGVINMAHGEMVMLGAYATFVVQQVFRSHFPDAFDLSLLVAIPAAFAVSGLAGIALERGVIRFLYGRPLETLLATWGLSLILQQAVRSLFGPTNQEVGTPSWMSGSIEVFSGLSLTNNRIAIIAFAAIVFAILTVLIRYTTFGLRMRAVTQNRAMAGAVGIRSGWIDALTFGLGSGVAGLAGVALSQIDNVSPNLGQGYIIDSFLVVVFGGVGNLWGTLVGAASLGIANKVLEPYSGAVLGKILILVLVILFIQKRPRGLFALRGRAAEA